jgi:macrolide-specific efflux system membrane fusion protein
MMFMNWKTERLDDGIKSPRKTKLMAAVFATGVLLTGCSLFPKEEEVLAPPLVEPAPVNYEVAKVERGTLVKSVKGSSTFTATDKKELSFRNPTGRLKSFLVQSGDVVKKGQVLAELDAGDLEHEIEVAKYEVDKAKLELMAVQQDNRYEVEAARLDVQKAEMNAKVLGTKLAVMELEKAKLKLQELQDTKQQDYLIQKARLNIREKELELAKLQKKWEETRLVSPMDGIVMFVSNEQVGDEIEPYQPLVTVGDPKKLLILYTAANAEAIQDVDIGMKATITLKDKTKAEGTVVQTPRNVPSGLPEDLADLYQRSLLIMPKQLPDSVEIGTPADIEVVIQKRENVLLIPRQALRDFSGRQFVQVLDGKSKKEVDVEVGVQTATAVEILKGLQEGQLVILD